jgi:hypothetical protein
MKILVQLGHVTLEVMAEFSVWVRLGTGCFYVMSHLSQGWERKAKLCSWLFRLRLE